MKTLTLVHNALKWAFRTFGDQLSLFIPLILFLLIGFIPPLIILMPFFSFYLTLYLINIASRLYHGEKIEQYSPYLIGFMPFIKSLAAMFLYSLIVTAGLILFIIPGIYLASRFYYIVYCIILDNSGIIESFHCSKRLTAQLPWHGCVLGFCAGILGATWFLLPVAALMNLYAYNQCKKDLILVAQ